MHGSRNDLAAPHVDHEVEVEEDPRDRRAKVGDVPRPDLVGTGRHMLTRWSALRWTRCRTMRELTLGAQDAVHARFGAKVDALVRKHRHDLLRRAIRVLGLVHSLEDGPSFGIRQLVGRCLSWPGPPVVADWLSLPALHRPWIDSKYGAGSALTRTLGHCRAHETKDHLPLLVEVSSSSSPKSASSFFLSARSAVTSASALSLRCNSRSSSRIFLLSGDRLFFFEVPSAAVADWATMLRHSSS